MFTSTSSANSMWTLVLIMMMETGPSIIEVEQFDSMSRCFLEREFYWDEQLPDDKTGLQMLCIRGVLE
jgi:hypothetical protein